MKNLILCFLLFSTMFCQAQNSIDLFTGGVFYSLPAKYNEPLSGQATESGTWLNLKIPIKLSEKLIWYNEFTHMYFDVDADITPTMADTFLTSMRLSAAILQTGVMYALGEKNAIQVLLVPRNNSDLNNADRKNGNWVLWRFLKPKYTATSPCVMV